MATRYEYYAGSTDSQFVIWGANWAAQTFTPAISHTITSVKVYIRRQGSDTDKYLYARIRATTGGLPSGGDLASGVVPASSLVLGSFTWVEITLGAGCELTAGTMYAIVLNYTGINDTVTAEWSMDNTSPTYAGGTSKSSADSGSSWTARAWDFAFEDWGDPIPTAPGGKSSASDLVQAGYI